MRGRETHIPLYTFYSERSRWDGAALYSLLHFLARAGISISLMRPADGCMRWVAGALVGAFTFPVVRGSFGYTREGETRCTEVRKRLSMVRYYCPFNNHLVLQRQVHLHLPSFAFLLRLDRSAAISPPAGWNPVEARLNTDSCRRERVQL